MLTKTSFILEAHQGLTLLHGSFRRFGHIFQTLASVPYIVTLLRTDFNPISPNVCECLAAQRSHWVHRAQRALRRKTYMQIATMTTFPGPCINVVLLPDRGFREKKNRTKQHILKVILWFWNKIAPHLTLFKLRGCLSCELKHQGNLWQLEIFHRVVQ